VASGEAPARIPYFPLEWCSDHYKFRSNDYCRTLDRLSGEERAAHDKLWAYVRAFMPSKSVGEDGKEVSVARFIDTHGLMVSEDPMDLLGSLFVILSFCPFGRSFFMLF
jgi:hypothetical protein